MESDFEKSSGASSDVQAGVPNIVAATSVCDKWRATGIWGPPTGFRHLPVGGRRPHLLALRHELHLDALADSRDGHLRSIIASLSKLPLAKILDNWGRFQGMALMLILWIIGFCMMASCRGVATYAAELKKTRVIVVPESFLIRYPKRFNLGCQRAHLSKPSTAVCAGLLRRQPHWTGLALACADVQQYMLVTSVCLLGDALKTTAFWRDAKLGDQQVKGLLA
ncbi:6afe1cc9-2752-46b4-941c-52e1efa99298 [Thermothielavioides terrestris]|uniref:6afe1cc9-2752-46b4-941c-52e1efa99298 n=1 Tax=Thermothielavioides terrestris TaxID=2587410 RepID=A0A446BDS5_9PEZI|nr:6afe1cc9-2752-46b4-941c-52e1efa99298 [Thermothielavioides terrestris]